MTTMRWSRPAVHIGRVGDALHRLVTALENLFLCVHPATVRRATLAFRHTYCLGAVVVSIWSVLIATGVLMMFHIRPTAPEIYHDISELTFAVTHGAFIRSMHRWAASAMVAVVLLHMLRVFFHRAYRRPRRATWWIGVGLLTLVLASSYTGYLLPWDQRAFWGVSVGAGMASAVPVMGPEIRTFMLGGPQIGSHTVLRFYVLHCFLVPAMTALLLAAHLWRVRRAGVQGPAVTDDHEQPDSGTLPSPPDRRQSTLASERPGLLAGTPAPRSGQIAPDEDERVNAFPHLLFWEVAVFQSVVIALALVALAADAPLDEIANPIVTPDPVKAPWYLVGLQELLQYYPPLVVGVVLPGLLITALLLVPVYSSRYTQIPLAAWPARSVRRLAMVAVVATAVFALQRVWIALLPAVVVIALALCARRTPEETRGIAGWLRRRSLGDWIMMWVVAVGSASTIIAVFFRGPGWGFVWPAGIAWFVP